MQSVQILLASYQGAEFIEAQIESLLQQSHPHTSILVRDDGSLDDTRTILQSYAEQGRLTWIPGDNVGVIRSFDILLRQAQSAAYYAYCDQDDVWLVDKLERAIHIMSQHPQSTPLLYFTQTELVDRDLNSLNIVQPHLSQPPGFGHALVQNVVTGCTAIMNNAARELLVSVEPDWEQVRMHDWWAYVVIAAHGDVIYDPFPSVKYRQHDNNQIGMKNLSLARRLRRFQNHDAIITRQTRELYRCYGETMPPEKRKLLEAFLAKDESLLARVQLILNNKIYRQKRSDNWILKCLLLLNRL